MMEEHVRVSIIMGIYNCEKTLKEAIDSILNQTYKHWELIMCDDGSVDNTYKIANDFAERYDNIYLLKNECNMGLAYTLNKCLQCARGEYIARMDGDDISLPQRLEMQIDFLERNTQYSFVSSAPIFFDENGEWATGNIIEEPQKADLVKGCQFCHAASVIRKKTYDDVGGYDISKRVLRVEDYHLWIKIYQRGQRGYNIAEPLYKIRDDSAAFKRRRFKYRLNEVYVKYLAIKNLKLPITKSIYLARPILVGILPTNVYRILHKKRLQVLEKRLKKS